MNLLPYILPPVHVMQKEIRLRVFGMTCDDCVAKVTAGLKEKKGVLSASVSLKDGTAVVVVDPSRIEGKDLEVLPIFKAPSRYRAQAREERPISACC